MKEQYLETNEKSILNQHPNFSTCSFSKIFISLVTFEFPKNDNSLFIKIGEGSYATISLAACNKGIFSQIITNKDSDLNDDPNKSFYITQLIDLAKKKQAITSAYVTNNSEAKLSSLTKNTNESLASPVCDSWILLLIECHKLKCPETHKDENVHY